MRKSNSYDSATEGEFGASNRHTYSVLSEDASLAKIPIALIQQQFHCVSAISLIIKVHFLSTPIISHHQLRLKEQFQIKTLFNIIYVA